MIDINHLWFISAVCLTVTIVIGTVALFSGYRYCMNPLMYFGLGAVIAGLCPRLHLLLQAQTFDGALMPPYAQLSVHVGLCCFVVGWTWRVWWYRRHNRRLHLFRL